MLTYLNNPALKVKCIVDMQAHRDAEQLVKGTYWDAGKGCAVGCLTHCGDSTKVHDQCESQFGIPKWLALLVDTIFEGLPNEAAMAWPDRFLRVMPVGLPIEALTPVRHKLAAWLLGPDSPSAEGNSHPIVAEAVAAIRVLHERAAAGETVSETDRSAAESSAWSAWSAAESAAESAAWSARLAAESAARSAAESAAWSAESAAESARSSAEFERIADKTISLLGEFTS